MATIVLQVVGAAIGGAIGGPVGATIGRAVGAAAGYAIDQKIFSKDQVITGPRLDSSRFLSSNNGTPIPRIYGRTQIGGQIIWATRFEEIHSQTKQGGKGGPTTKISEFTYLANFAVGICAGPVSRIGRIWADGTELDLSNIKFRIHLGSNAQLPDPLIEALQSAGNTPAYRGHAYVVFEDFALSSFGNRIPQLTFEVIRAIGKLETSIKSVCLIPGATAYGYSPVRQQTNSASGATLTHNRHTLVAQSDWEASLDELQALCPNLETVSLIVAWFGNDLRAANCQIMPGVEHAAIDATGHPWLVSGTTPNNAHLISSINSEAAFGSTPTDKSIIEAIADLHFRGLKVALYPFVMMDISPDNILPDPHGNTAQPAYPWRGEITCHPAIGQVGSVDQTAASAGQIAAFTGDAQNSEFTALTDTIQFAGSQQWSYRRMVLHYAHLCALAGGVEQFIIGSELKGLTRVRNDMNGFPFVDSLVTLASDVAATLGTSSQITYGADWSEYFGYHPADSSNDLFFNLDPLWASPAIHAIGIDNYMPIADWRANGDPGDELAQEYDIEYFKRNIAAGEGYDWYYASSSERQSGTRTSITDGTGEPWVWRYKDLKSWWENPHHERINGVRSPTPTAWLPQSKPFWFTELGCPAMNFGANQPNVFHDEKSSQSAIPYFSSGARDDLMQRNFLQAHFEFWTSGTNLAQNNPVSSLYSGTMVDVSQISIWAWDARPFPAFPMRTDIWSDRNNWLTGHWLNGRLGNCSLGELIAQILTDFSFPNYSLDTLPGWVDGFIIPAQASARQVLEPLLSLFGATATSHGGLIRFIPASPRANAIISLSELVEKPDQPTITVHHAQESDLPAEAIIHHDELADNIQGIASKSRRLEGLSKRQIQMQLPAALPAPFATRLADARVREAWVGRDKLTFALASQALQYAAADIISLTDQRYQGLWKILAIEDGYERQLTLRRIEPAATMSFPALLPTIAAGQYSGFGKPLSVLLDIPTTQTSATHTPRLLLAIAADPWASNYTCASSPDIDGFEIRKTTNKRATIGKLLSPITQGPQSRWDFAATLSINLLHGQFDSKSDLQILGGANALALATDDGQWELLQFQSAVLENDGSWTLSKLLRAQLGTELAMAAGSSIGNTVVVLDSQVEFVEIDALSKSLPLFWRVGPSSDAISSPNYHQQSLTFRDSAAKPFSPVHLQAKIQPNNDLSIEWIRRTRLFGDDWEVEEIPLGEASEAYRLTIYNGQTQVRVLNSTTPNMLYTAADQLADFAALPTSLSVSVAQLDAFNNPGTARPAVLTPAA